MSLTVEPLHNRFAARVTGVDLRTAIRPEVFQQIRALLAEHLVLVFPDQPINDDEQIRFSRLFGELEVTKVGSYGEGSPLVQLTNVDDAGDVVADDHRMNMVHRANGLWHSDSSFKPIPAYASILSARQVPPVGGETQFASMVAAFEDLEPDRQRTLADAVAVHSFATSRDRIDPGLATPAERRALPPVRQRVVRRIPETGRRALYLGSHTETIEGMEHGQAATLIRSLLQFATREENVYTHHWRPGDLVCWDNRAVVHRGRPFARGEHARVMVRTTVAGDGPTVAG
jgi:alpha-ketoglutarate-dependent 2,4-dichlorophenoxyacetate dioxygenase